LDLREETSSAKLVAVHRDGSLAMTWTLSRVNKDRTDVTNSPLGAGASRPCAVTSRMRGGGTHGHACVYCHLGRLDAPVGVAMGGGG